MQIHLDKNSPIPIGVQIKEQLRMLIESGTYKSGDRLPSINQLADFLDVNKNTIVGIYKFLEADGYINSLRGKGVFVSAVKPAGQIDSGLLEKVDSLIRDVKTRGMDCGELVNLISSRFALGMADRKARAIFITNISQEIADVNAQKLRQSIHEADFEGLWVGKDSSKESRDSREELARTLSGVDLLVVPGVMYEYVRAYLPKDKPVIKSSPNLKYLESIKRGTEKKSKIAVIGLNQTSAQILEGIFISSGYFRPRLVLSMSEVDKYKKDLKDMDSIVLCLSARGLVEKLKQKYKDIFFFSDYLDDQSINEIRESIQKSAENKKHS